MLVVVLVLENPDRFAIRLSAVRFGYLSEGDFSTDLDLVQEVGRLINGLIRVALQCTEDEHDDEDDFKFRDFG